MAFHDLPPQPAMNPRADVYAATALALSRAVAEKQRCVLDIAYGADYWQKLDIYLPAESGLRDLPVFLCIHGGGWTHGYKEWMGFMAPPIVSLPAIYVSVSYRLSPTHRHPAQLEDCLEALAWVHRNIALHGGNPDRIFIGGHSAGAHLSSLVALRRDLHARYGLPEGVVKACFPFSGVYGFDNDACASVGAPLFARDEDKRDASPIAHVAGNRTPFFVTWAENDGPYATTSGPEFLAALRTQPGRVESHVFTQFDHFSINIAMMMPDNLWVRTLRAWMAGDPKTAKVG